MFITSNIQYIFCFFLRHSLINGRIDRQPEHIMLKSLIYRLGCDVFTIQTSSIAEAAVRGQCPGITCLRIITSPHSLLFKHLMVMCDLIMMWCFHHHSKERCLADTINLSIFLIQLFFRITCRFISTGESLAYLQGFISYYFASAPRFSPTLQYSTTVASTVQSVLLY